MKTAHRRFRCNKRRKTITSETYQEKLRRLREPGEAENDFILGEMRRHGTDPDAICARFWKEYPHGFGETFDPDKDNDYYAPAPPVTPEEVYHTVLHRWQPGMTDEECFVRVVKFVTPRFWDEEQEGWLREEAKAVPEAYRWHG